MGEIRDYSVTADDNNSTPPAGAPEGMAPSTVNNTMREAYARIKRWYDDAQGAKTTAGSSNTYTLAAARTVASYAAGDNYVIKANHSNTGAATLNVDSLGAKAIVTPALNALEADSIRAGGVYQIAYEASADKFILVNGAHPSESQITLKNPTSEDTSGGRESQVVFKALQSGSEESTLVKIQASHEGTSDDEKGQLIVGVNDGNDGASPTTAVTIASTGTVTFAKQPSFPDANPRQSNNFIYNGDMQVCQRAISVADLGNGDSGYHVQDRWQFYESGTPNTIVAMSQSTTAPDGFNSSLKLDCTTPDGTIGSADLIALAQIFEGRDLQSINKGDAQAKKLTISFWVNTTVTGTYIINMYDNDNNRTCSQSYTVSSSNTWEYKSVTFPADTTGAFDNDENASLYVYWGLQAGTDWNGSSATLPTTWESNNNPDRFKGQAETFSSDANNFHITGVQMELGEVATEFQYESFADNLSRCQRYFMAYGGTGTDANDYVVVGTGLCVAASNGWVEINPPTPMRNRPTITFNNMYLFDASNRFLNSVDYVSVEDSATVYRSKSTIWVNVVRQTTDLTTGRGLQLYTDNAEDSYFWVSADL